MSHYITLSFRLIFFRKELVCSSISIKIRCEDLCDISLIPVTTVRYSGDIFCSCNWTRSSFSSVASPRLSNISIKITTAVYQSTWWWPKVVSCSVSMTSQWQSLLMYLYFHRRRGLLCSPVLVILKNVYISNGSFQEYVDQ